MKITTRFTSRLGVVGGAAAVAVVATLGQPAFAGPIDAFYAGGRYTYCDAKLLATFWGEGVGKAKMDAGRKLELGNRRYVNDKLRSARTYAASRGVRCTFADANNPTYSYNDAVSLARYWGMNRPWDAKLKIGRLLTNGQNIHIRRSLRAARGGRY